MDTLCSDLVLSICTYLDDTSYIYFWITSKRYCRMLQSEIFLKKLFRDRKIQGLTYADLRRGFKNIIERPTVTVLDNQEIKNVYRGGMNQFLLDIFNRVHIVYDDHLVPTEYFTQCDIQKWGNAYRIRTIDNNLVILDKDYALHDFIPDVETAIWATGSLIFRRDNKYVLYALNKGEITIDCVVPHEKIKSLAITLTSENISDYQIHAILDVDGQLIVGHKIMARDVSRFGYSGDYIIYVTNTDSTLYYRSDGKTIEIAKEVAQYKLISDLSPSNKFSINYLTKNGDLFRWKEGTIILLDRNVETMFMFHGHFFWYNKKTSSICNTRGGVAVVNKPVSTICSMRCASSLNNLNRRYIIVMHKSLLSRESS